MKVQFSVKMQIKYMYNYLMAHTYRGPAGIISVILGIAAFILCFATIGRVKVPFTLCYGFIGILFLLYLPFVVFKKAREQVLLVPMFRKPLDYTVDGLGISTRQDEKQDFVEWKDILKVRETRMCVIVYRSKREAFVWPKECMAEGQYETLLEIMREAMPKESRNR